MKTEPNDNINPTGDHRDCEPRGGLTKREYFAALAMQGMLVNGGQTEHGGKTYSPQQLASLAVYQADALIRALNVTP